MGNPTSFSDYKFTWENGRELATVKDRSTNEQIASYEYNSSGMRISKTTSDGTAYYAYDESNNLIFEKHNNYSMVFHYDGNGVRTHFDYKSASIDASFYYRYNAQGDVIALLDSTGAVVAEYDYTAYGRQIKRSEMVSSTVGNRNPFRYRGYYYDTETDYYYLQSRYYDAYVGRFINSDAVEFLGATGTLLSLNMFAYCENEPVNMKDDEGYRSKSIKKTVKNVTKKFVRPLVKKIKKSLSKINLTYSKGINLSIASGIWAFNAQIGVSFDTKGNIAVQYSLGGGVSTGSGLSFTGYQSFSNAPDIYSLEKTYYQLGGSYATLIEIISLAVGADLMYMPNPALNTGYYGITRNVGFGVPSQEIHVEWGETSTIKNTRINIFGMARRAYARIMRW